MRSARARRALTTIAVATAVALPFSGLDASASGSTAISARAFGMHFLNPANPVLLSAGSTRIWGGTAVSWAQLQPHQGETNGEALAGLDNIVRSMRAHGAQPMITLGMTPAWAAHHCKHTFGGVNWGIQTCAPAATGTGSPWGNYVRLLAKHYQGQVQYFELWNEPSLHNGYNDSIRTLAKMQATAHSILHSYGAQLVSPAIPFTDGSPNNGLKWLDTFLQQPGGKAFDILGLHLYPSDAAARGGYGPEWSMQALASARAVLQRRHVTGKPTWNTETNVGRIPAHSSQGAGTRGAAMVARTYLLATQNNVARTFWYAADDRQWGGTWLESKTMKSLSYAGHAYTTVQKLLIGAHPRGCSRTTVGTNKWHYACRYRLANGKSMIAVWSTGASFTYHGPRGTQQAWTVVGGVRTAHHSTALKIGAAPQYVIGTFKV
jgi:hypothetical protein